MRLWTIAICLCAHSAQCATCPQHVADAYGSGDCSGRADGSSCCYFSQPEAGCTDADAKHGPWCGWELSLCKRGSCRSPVDAYCDSSLILLLNRTTWDSDTRQMVPLADDCSQTCFLGGANATQARQLCLEERFGRCLGKAVGAPCSYRDGRQVSRCGLSPASSLMQAGLGQSCVGSRCNYCVDPRRGACLDKQEGSTCDDYTEYSDGGCVVCLPGNKGIRHFRGGTCFTNDDGELTCRGASRVSNLGQRSAVHAIAVLVTMGMVGEFSA